jgi:hypothetical protein
MSLGNTRILRSGERGDQKAEIADPDASPVLEQACAKDRRAARIGSPIYCRVEASDIRAGLRWTDGGTAIGMMKGLPGWSLQAASSRNTRATVGERFE